MLIQITVSTLKSKSSCQLLSHSATLLLLCKPVSTCEESSYVLEDYFKYCKYTEPNTEIAQFTEAERAVLATLIQAIATATTASIGPVDRLNAGLSATGVTALNEIVQSLRVAVASLRAAATIDWTIE